LFAASLLILSLRHDAITVRLSHDRANFLIALKLNGRAFGAAVVLTLANAWFVYNLIRRILALREQGELYVGGQSNFVQDTIGSLVSAYLYGHSYPASLRTIIIVILF